MSQIGPLEPNQSFVHDYMDIANEYYTLSHKYNLSDKEAARLGEILKAACDSDNLSLLLNEINELIFKESNELLNRNDFCDIYTRNSKRFALIRLLSPLWLFLVFSKECHSERN